MARVRHQGKPFDPPTINGFEFHALDPDEKVWEAEVDHGSLGLFVYEGSPFYLAPAVAPIEPPVVIPPPPPLPPPPPVEEKPLATAFKAPKVPKSKR